MTIRQTERESQIIEIITSSSVLELAASDYDSLETAAAADALSRAVNSGGPGCWAELDDLDLEFEEGGIIRYRAIVKVSSN